MTRLEIAVALICGPFADYIKKYDTFSIETSSKRDGLFRQIFILADEIIAHESCSKQLVPSKFVPVEPKKKDDIPF